VAVPTVGEWGVVLLSALAGLMGARQLRHRHHARVR
jgi:hypothetical protein